MFNQSPISYYFHVTYTLIPGQFLVPDLLCVLYRLEDSSFGIAISSLQFSPYRELDPDRGKIRHSTHLTTTTHLPQEP